MDYPHWLLVAFSLIWIALAIRPHDRSVWLTEHVLTLVSVVALAVTYPGWPLSDLSYTLIAVFLVLHTVGGHYTYARVPYAAVAKAHFGLKLGEPTGWTRNHYDRVVHLAFGVLITYPLYELLERYAQPTGAWSLFLAPVLIMASSMAFEVFEWWAAELLGAGAGLDYLGSQGDDWDAQKDMAMAAGGSIIATGVVAILT